MPSPKNKKSASHKRNVVEEVKLETLSMDEPKKAPSKASVYRKDE